MGLEDAAKLVTDDTETTKNIVTLLRTVGKRI